MTYTKEQKKEFRKINRESAEIIAAVDELAKQDAVHPFSRRALDMDRKIDYPAEIYAELTQMHADKDKKAMTAVQEAGAVSTAHTMRRYCDVLSNTSATDADREKAIIGAVQLLFVIAKLGRENTEGMNQKVMETAAKDAPMTDIYRVAKKQFEARKTFYSKEVLQHIRQNSRVNG